MIQQLGTQDWGDMAPNDPMLRQFAATCGELKAVVENWTALNADALTTLNATLTKNGLKPIAAPAPALTLLECGSPAPTR